MQLKKVTTLFHPKVKREEKFTMLYHSKNDRGAGELCRILLSLVRRACVGGLGRG